MMVRNWGASSIAADKIAAAHKMAACIVCLPSPDRIVEKLIP